MLEFHTLEGDPKSMNEAVHETVDSLRDIADQLHSLANAFERTGNSKVAGNLLNLAEALDERSEILSHTWGRHVGEMLQESTQASTNMLKAALAGLEVGSRSLKS